MTTVSSFEEESIIKVGLVSGSYDSLSNSNLCSFIQHLYSSLHFSISQRNLNINNERNFYFSFAEEFRQNLKSSHKDF
jgi:hypothetical protein